MTGIRVVLLAATTCGLGVLTACGPSEDDGDGPLDPRMNGMVEAHNAVRASAEPTPTPALEPLVWSRALEEDAADYAAKCIWDHDIALLTQLEQGENLAAWSEADFASDQDAVDGWASEIAFYDYDANTCVPGEQCGHYTQVVWRETREVGCAVAACPNGLDGWPEGREIWVCRYSPPGNYVGEKPY